MATSHQMKKDMRDGIDTLRQGGADMLETARSKFDDIRHDAQDMAQAGYDRLSDAGGSLLEIVKSRPVECVIAAACVGCVVGLFLRRR